MATVTQDSAPSSVTGKSSTVNPSEVGWQFVPQYYTYVNKQPNKLHCFYTKNSTFIHGTEGEDGKPCFGQQEIHSKILSLNYTNCKVFIDSVDAQSSANNGIIIQVIGEMSNNGEPWRKFVQTFFLAEQPNGYFVLNDIFRYLKEEGVGEEEEEAEASEDLADQNAEEHGIVLEQHNELPSPPQPQFTAPVEPIAVAPEPQVLAPPTPEPIPQPPSPAPVDAPAGVPVNGVNGTPAPEPPVERLPTPPPVESQTIPEAPVEPTPEPEPVVSTPAVIPPPVPAAAAPPVAAPVPAPAPSGPRSWANMAASNGRQWGKQIAPDAKGISAAGPAATPAAVPPPQAPASRPQSGRPDGHPAYVAAQNLTNPQCFVKGVTDNVSQVALVNYLTNRYGPVKDVEIIRNKACAFLEFTTVEAARKAIIASLPIPQGGEGGIRVDIEGGGYARITVETRKERGERPAPRPRGGAPAGAPAGQHAGPQNVNGGHDGAPPVNTRGFGGRGRGQMRGRGAPPAK